MNLQDAYKTLGLPAGVSEAERHEAFAIQRKKLEEKLAKAPTPGLAQKYRDSIARMEEAIEVIELAADGGDLPALQPVAGSSAGTSGTKAKPSTEASGKSRERKPARKSSAAKEITIAAILVLLLCGGAAGWWFGLENPKRVEADRLVELAVALEAEGEWKEAKSHFEQALAQKSTWPAAVEGLSRAETEVSRMEAEFARSEQERLRDTDRALVQARVAEGQEQWSEALSGYQAAFKLSPENVEAEEGVVRLEKLLEHARGALVVRSEPGAAVVRLSGKAEELSPANFVDLKLGTYKVEVEKKGYNLHKQQVTVRKDDTVVVGPVRLTRSKGAVLLKSLPEGMEYILRQLRSDVPGEKAFEQRSGKTPVAEADLPTGSYEVVMKRPDWPDFKETVEVVRDQKYPVEWEFAQGDVVIKSTPPGMPVFYNQGELGKTPYVGRNIPVGEHTYVIKRKGWPDAKQTVKVVKDQPVTFEWDFAQGDVILKSTPSGMEAFEQVGGKLIPLGKTPKVLQKLPVGSHTYVLRRSGWPDAKKTLVVKKGELEEFSWEFAEGVVEFDSQPQGVTVSLHDKVLGKTPFNKSLPVDDYIFDYKAYWETELVSNHPVKLSLTKKGAKLNPVLPVGLLKWSSNRDTAVVYALDLGGVYGDEPSFLKEGIHDLVCKNTFGGNEPPFFAPTTNRVMIKKGQTTEQDFNLDQIRDLPLYTARLLHGKTYKIDFMHYEGEVMISFDEKKRELRLDGSYSRIYRAGDGTIISSNKLRIDAKLRIDKASIVKPGRFEFTGVKKGVEISSGFFRYQGNTPYFEKFKHNYLNIIKVDVKALKFKTSHGEGVWTDSYGIVHGEGFEGTIRSVKE